MFRRTLRLSLGAPLALALLASAAAAQAVPPGTSTGARTVLRMQEPAFQDAMRTLWMDHVLWTRMFIVELAADSLATEATAERLFQNQADIGKALKPFYGDKAGDELTVLLREHIQIAAELLVAAKAGDDAAVEQASARWHVNGKGIAGFLSAANPKHWPLERMEMMMRDHLDLTLAEAVARLQGDFAGDIAAYGEVQTHALQMADTLSKGIVAQFPKVFKVRSLGCPALRPPAALPLMADRPWWDGR